MKKKIFRIPWLYILFVSEFGALIDGGVELAAEKGLALLIKTDTFLYDFIFSFLIVAIIEEITRFLIIKGALKRYNGRCGILSPMIYAIVCSLAFGSGEMITYLLDGAPLWSRFIALLGHIAYGVFMGRALYQYSENQINRTQYCILVFFIPIFTHGLHDFMVFRLRSFSIQEPGLWMLWSVGLSVLALICISSAFIMFIKTLKMARKVDVKNLKCQQQTEAVDDLQTET